MIVIECIVSWGGNRPQRGKIDPFWSKSVRHWDIFEYNIESLDLSHWYLMSLHCSKVLCICFGLTKKTPGAKIHIFVFMTGSNFLISRGKTDFRQVPQSIAEGGAGICSEFPRRIYILYIRRMKSELCRKMFSIKKQRQFYVVRRRHTECLYTTMRARCALWCLTIFWCLVKCSLECGH